MEQIRTQTPVCDGVRKDLPEPVPATDAVTFARLYQEFAERLYRFACAETMSRQLAEDVVGDTLLRAFEHRDQFDPQRGSLAAWVFGIARHEVVNQRRAVTRARRVLLRLLPNPTTTTALDDTLVEREQVEELQRVLRLLRVEDREVITLRFGAELSHDDIAAVVGISPGAARVRLHRAMQRLRQAMAAANEENGEHAHAR